MQSNPLTTWRSRPYSWSQHSSWAYNPHEWYKRYVLGEKMPESPALLFGKAFADSCEAGAPLAPVTLYSVIEHPMEAELDGIALTGFGDSWEPSTRLLREYKTGVKAWDQKRVDEHGQLTMYSLLLWLIDKTRPEDLTIHLDWLPVVTTPSFTLDFQRGEDNQPVIHTFETNRTMTDILRFASDIKRTRTDMEAYIKKMGITE